MGLALRAETVIPGVLQLGGLLRAIGSNRAIRQRMPLEAFLGDFLEAQTFRSAWDVPVKHCSTSFVLMPTVSKICAPR